MRLIDADELKSKKEYSEERHEYIVPVAAIDWANAVEAAPVVYGQWEYNGERGEYRCTNCDDWGADDDERTPHCPNCGAKMDGGTP